MQCQMVSSEVESTSGAHHICSLLAAATIYRPSSLDESKRTKDSSCSPDFGSGGYVSTRS